MLASMAHLCPHNVLLLLCWYVLVQQGTDFSTWSEADIKVFLDERGGDFDDCTTFQQLVRVRVSCAHLSCQLSCADACRNWASC